jgi:hypothetical protein
MQPSRTGCVRTSETVYFPEFAPWYFPSPATSDVILLRRFDSQNYLYWLVLVRWSYSIDPLCEYIVLTLFIGEYIVLTCSTNSLQYYPSTKLIIPNLLLFKVMWIILMQMLGRNRPLFYLRKNQAHSSVYHRTQFCYPFAFNKLLHASLPRKHRYSLVLGLSTHIVLLTATDFSHSECCWSLAANCKWTYGLTYRRYWMYSFHAKPFRADINYVKCKIWR